MRLFIFLSLFLLEITNSEAKYKNLVNNLDITAYNASNNYVFIVDYSIPSNKNRFFIWNLKLQKIQYGCWCAHGFGGGSTATSPKFSNTIGSNCSSLGLFLIDKKQGTSTSYGYKYYAVDGLSNTNSNARVRQILIHPWSSVTEDYVNNLKVPMNCDYRSAGCFTVTHSGFSMIHKIITNENKRILLIAIK